MMSWLEIGRREGITANAAQHIGERALRKLKYQRFLILAAMAQMNDVRDARREYAAPTRRRRRAN